MSRAATYTWLWLTDSLHPNAFTSCIHFEIEAFCAHMPGLGLSVFLLICCSFVLPASQLAFPSKQISLSLSFDLSLCQEQKVKQFQEMWLFSFLFLVRWGDCYQSKATAETCLDELYTKGKWTNLKWKKICLSNNTVKLHMQLFYLYYFSYPGNFKQIFF